MQFKLHAPYKPTGDQPQAIEKLSAGLERETKHQVLLGVTGSGKTFTVANVIERLQIPTLVISHNKTLAGQLYQELREFFPKNAVSYFVSYYDYYQPEAYIPQTDTYIEKETDINQEIDKLRLRATTNLLTRNDAIVVASVSCIYNIGSPIEYGNFILEVTVGEEKSVVDMGRRLVELQYERADFGFHRGTFRIRGDTIDIFPAYEDTALRIETQADVVKKISHLDPLNGKTLDSKFQILDTIIYPAKHYMTDPAKFKNAFAQIREDLEKRIEELKSQGKDLEAYRIEKRVTYDLEMIQELGYVNGIENYSRYFDGRNPGDPPYTLLDYYRQMHGENFLVVIDESHMTVPQIGGMYNGDRSRKQMLVDFGFRLPAAFDNRPLRFEEFLRRVPKVIYTSATPAAWELSQTRSAYRLPTTDYSQKKTVDGRQQAVDGLVEQLVRPTGISDPEIEIKPTKGQINDLINQIQKRVKNGQRTLVTTLTKRMAEDLSTFLTEREIKVQYLHSDIDTLDRSDILDQLRLGEYDVLVGINLLREGLDLPEVSLVAILDADKEGFLRSQTSLIQTMGRAARHIEGKVIMYADTITGSMQRAIQEVERRRKIQLDWNKKHNIIPQTITKPIREKLVDRETTDPEPTLYGLEKKVIENLSEMDTDDMTPQDRKKLIIKLKRAMNEAARDLNFELAAKLRDRIHKMAP